MAPLQMSRTDLLRAYRVKFLKPAATRARVLATAATPHARGLLERVANGETLDARSQARVLTHLHRFALGGFPTSDNQWPNPETFFNENGGVHIGLVPAAEVRLGHIATPTNRHIPFPTIFVQGTENDATAKRFLADVRPLLLAQSARLDCPLRIIARTSAGAALLHGFASERIVIDHFDSKHGVYPLPKFGMDLWHQGYKIAFGVYEGDRIPFTRVGDPKKLDDAPLAVEPSSPRAHVHHGTGLSDDEP